MAETAKCSWYAFDRNVAVEGTLVGFRQSDDSDLSQTGHLFINTTDDKYFDSYKVVILGHTLWVSDTGAVTKVFPADGLFSTGQTLQMVVCKMETTYGTQQAITRSVGYGNKSVANITALEPRDQFATIALQAILDGLDHPESFGDASILSICQSAYRWAQGMMIAAADARAAVGEQESSGSQGRTRGSDAENDVEYLDINTKEITDISDKLLYNLYTAIDNFKISVNNNHRDVKSSGLKISDTVKADVSGTISIDKMPSSSSSSNS